MVRYSPYIYGSPRQHQGPRFLYRTGHRARIIVTTPSPRQHNRLRPLPPLRPTLGRLGGVVLYLTPRLNPRLSNGVGNLWPQC